MISSTSQLVHDQRRLVLSGVLPQLKEINSLIKDGLIECLTYLYENCLCSAGPWSGTLRSGRSSPWRARGAGPSRTETAG